MIKKAQAKAKVKTGEALSRQISVGMPISRVDEVIQMAASLKEVAEAYDAFDQVEKKNSLVTLLIDGVPVSLEPEVLRKVTSAIKKSLRSEFDLQTAGFHKIGIDPFH